MDDVGALLRAAGTEVVEALAPSSGAGTRTRYGTVKAVGPTTLDVELAGGTVSGVPMTTACYGARVGDRVMLAVDGPLVTATGILANADSGPYVVLWEGDGNQSAYYIRTSQPPAGFERLRVYWSTNDYARGVSEVVHPQVGRRICATATSTYEDNRIWVSSMVWVIKDQGIDTAQNGGYYARSQCSIPQGTLRATDYIFATRIEGWRV